MGAGLAAMVGLVIEEMRQCGGQALADGAQVRDGGVGETAGEGFRQLAFGDAAVHAHFGVGLVRKVWVFHAAGKRHQCHGGP